MYEEIELVSTDIPLQANRTILRIPNHSIAYSTPSPCTLNTHPRHHHDHHHIGHICSSKAECNHETQIIRTTGIQRAMLAMWNTATVFVTGSIFLPTVEALHTTCVQSGVWSVGISGQPGVDAYLAMTLLCQRPMYIK